MSPLDRTLEFKMALEKAERAWFRWKKSPLGDLAFEHHGEALLQAFVDATVVYLNYARHQTAVRLRDPSMYSQSLAQRSKTAATDDEDLDVPDFLRRPVD